MPRYQLRPIGPGDDEYLFAIYASTRQEELAPLDWTAEQREAFLRQQFEAQRRHYHGGAYPGAVFQIISVEGQPAGRWYLHARPDEFRIIDLALLPEFRGKGIGTALIQELLGQAGRSSRRVTLHVESFNPAQRLYERLGFRQVSSNGVYYLLEWTPNSL